MQEIIEFKYTPTYAHLKYLHPEYTDEELAILAVNRPAQKNGSAYMVQRYNLPEHGTSMKLTSSSISADGIYDILLTNCENLRTISLETKNRNLILFSRQYSEDAPKTVRIPLAFDKLDEVKHGFLFYNGDTYDSSIIPLISAMNDELILTINPEAKTDLKLGAVYMGNELRRSLCHYPCKFYVEGKEFISYSGYYQTYEEYCKNGRGCCIC